MIDWMLRQARLTDDGPLQDVAIHQGQIITLAPNLSMLAHETWDLDGRVILPGLVDLHTHLDKAYSTVHNKSGTLLEAIDVWEAYKQQQTPARVRRAALKSVRNAVKHGVTSLRSHLNMGERGCLDNLAEMLALREEMRGVIDLQFVALGNPGLSDEDDALMSQAIDLGVDFIGAAPALLPEPLAGVDAAFALAEATGKPLDLHVDETEDPAMLTLEYIAEKTIAHGMQGQVTAGHCCSLAFVDEETAARVIDQVAEAGITIVTLPSCNLVLMGREMSPAPRGVTRVKQLLARGVTVCAASDNVRDPFNPFGAYDLLHIANLNAHVTHMTGEAELYTSLDMVTTQPAQAFGHSNIGLIEDAPADFVVVDTYTVLDAILHPPERLATFKNGQPIVRTEIQRQWTF